MTRLKLFACPLAAFVLCVCASLADAVPPVPAVVIQPSPAKQSKYEAIAAKTGVFVRKDEVSLAAARDQGIDASVIRLEDLSAHQVAYAFKVSLSEKRGSAVFSEEEMADLKDAVDFIVLNYAKISESNNHVRLEYRALSGASIGYSVHRVTDEGDELPPTAYIEVPRNPYYPNLGGLQRVTPQILQRIIAEAQQTVDNLKGEKK